MRRAISIRGDGVTACCCTRLLRGSGFEVSVSSRPHPRVPFVLVSSRSQVLLNDVFGDSKLFSGMEPLRKRIVLWGSQAKPVIVPHLAVVAPEDVLVERLWSRVLPGGNETSESLDWSIATSSPPAGIAEHHFGSRTAFATAVDLLPTTEAGACWIESLERGWLFLLGLGNGRGSLLSVGEEAESLLGASRLVGEQIDVLGLSTGKFFAHPRILAKLCDGGWLACGTGAMAFDPLCGDGTGNAVREAILASAVIQGVFKGFPASDVLAHYSLRLNAGFLRHLELCLEFYREARSSSWWDAEVALLERGIEWTKEQIAAAAVPPRYRLVDFQLEEIIRA
jgi:hypothetical protein